VSDITTEIRHVLVIYFQAAYETKNNPSSYRLIFGQVYIGLHIVLMILR
jgi:hypothetical protein